MYKSFHAFPHDISPDQLEPSELTRHTIQTYIDLLLFECFSKPHIGVSRSDIGS